MTIINRLLKSSLVAQSQDFLDLIYVAQTTATGATPGLASLVPAQKTASPKVWMYETGSAASPANILSAAIAARLIDEDGGPLPSGQNSLQPGYNSTISPAALASLRSGVVAYFATAATVPAQSMGFVFTGIGATTLLGLEYQEAANTGSGTDFIASGAVASTYWYGAPTILTNALFPTGAGGALIGPSGAVISAASNPVVLANGVIFGVVPRPAAATAGDLMKVTLRIKA